MIGRLEVGCFDVTDRFWGRFDVIGRLGVGCFDVIGRAEKGWVGSGRGFAVIVRAEKGRGCWWNALL